MLPSLSGLVGAWVRATCILHLLSKKLGILLSGVTFILEQRLLALLEMHTLLGHFSRFILLARSSLSCFDEVYSFARQPSERENRVLPPVCVSELFAAVLTLLQIRIDLGRLWLGLLCATDASQVFGFGASVAAIRPCRARQLSRLSDRRHYLVRLQRDRDVFDEPERNRQVVAHHVGIPKSSFNTVARFEAHPGALEAAGLTLLFKWLLQSVSRYNRRIIILPDARAILGAAQHGRTSARSFQREIRRIAALELAGNL